jgi:hypothetical protein
MKRLIRIGADAALPTALALEQEVLCASTLRRRAGGIEALP